MIDGRQVGPLELDDIVGAGVMPGTYVWCKGMPDWTMASEVPDICRYFRLRLAGALPPRASSSTSSDQARAIADEKEQEELMQQLPPMARNFVRKSGIKLKKEDFPDPAGSPDSKWLPVVIYTVSFILLAIGFYLLYA